MKRHGRALFESLALHGFFAGTLIILPGMPNPPVPPEIMRLDFYVQQQMAAQKTQNAHQPENTESTPVPQQPQPAPPQRLEPAAAKIRHNLAAVTPAPKKPVELKNTVETPEAPIVTPAASAAGEDKNSGPTTAASSAPESPAIPADEAYKQANFSAIRDSIRGNLRYPMLARKRGWSGQVEVAFTITPDGTINGLKILTSSGFSVLDDQALAAIRRAAPFSPPPRMAATLVMPITFRLN